MTKCDVQRVNNLRVFGDGQVLAEIRKNVHALKESYDEKGVCLMIKATPGTLTVLNRRLAS